jgi:hypothetical protein
MQAMVTISRIANTTDYNLDSGKDKKNISSVTNLSYKSVPQFIAMIRVQGNYKRASVGGSATLHHIVDLPL